MKSTIPVFCNLFAEDAILASYQTAYLVQGCCHDPRYDLHISHNISPHTLTTLHQCDYFSQQESTYLHPIKIMQTKILNIAGSNRVERTSSRYSINIIEDISVQCRLRMNTNRQSVSAFESLLNSTCYFLQLNDDKVAIITIRHRHTHIYSPKVHDMPISDYKLHLKPELVHI